MHASTLAPAAAVFSALRLDMRLDVYLDMLQKQAEACGLHIVGDASTDAASKFLVVTRCDEYSAIVGKAR